MMHKLNGSFVYTRRRRGVGSTRVLDLKMDGTCSWWLKMHAVFCASTCERQAFGHAAAASKIFGGPGLYKYTFQCSLEALFSILSYVPPGHQPIHAED